MKFGLLFTLKATFEEEVCMTRVRATETSRKYYTIYETPTQPTILLTSN